MAETNKIPVACFAPPLTDEILVEYRKLAAQAEPEVKDAINTLLRCVESWWNLPESTKAGVKWTLASRSGRTREFAVVPLEDDHVKQLWDVTPWMRELNTLSALDGGGLFDTLPAGPLRDAAFHLLWHCKELTLDREPLTQDKLKEV